MIYLESLRSILGDRYVNTVPSVIYKDNIRHYIVARQV